jgi:hypothetical protein
MCANSSKIILDLCGGTGSWSAPYSRAGYDVRVVTLPANDIRLYSPPPNVYGILAAPPCTEFSFAKHFHGKGHYQHNHIEGLSVVDACLRVVWRCRETLKFWALENPKGYLYKWLGNPALTFDPYEFGDPYQKRTCLWGSFTPPQRKPYAKPTLKFSMLKSKDIHPAYYGKLSRQERRAITPPCFAQAFYEANK